MSSSTVVRTQSGGTIAVRTGVLRGAGPQGPMGPAGPAGPIGVAGPTGATPVLSQMRSHFFTTGAVAVGGDGLWYDLAMPLIADGSEPQDLIVTPSDPYNFKFLTNGTYFGYLRVRFEPRTGSEYSGVAGNSRRVRVVDAASLAVIAEISIAAAVSEPTIVAFPLTFPNVDISRGYKVQGYSDDSAGISITNRSLRLFVVNAGPAGPQGIQGPVGATGPQGAAGATGSAGTGYTSSDALIGGTDSTISPGGAALTTPDQAIPHRGQVRHRGCPYCGARQPGLRRAHLSR
jgi:hypothetical protein